MLPDDDGILIEIGNIGAANVLGVLLHDHPANVGVEEAFANRVRVLVGIGVAVMGTMSAGPPADGTLNGTTTNGSEEDLERETCGIRGMCPETMITWTH